MPNNFENQAGDISRGTLWIMVIPFVSLIFVFIAYNLYKYVTKPEPTAKEVCEQKIQECIERADVRYDRCSNAIVKIQRTCDKNFKQEEQKCSLVCK